MKKYSLWIGAFVLMLGSTVYAQDVSIYINNKSVKTDVTPQVKEDTTYVPVSFISRQLGAEVKWEDSKVIIIKGDDEIIFTMDDVTAYKNGIQIQLPNAPYISNNRTFVPLRSISELLDCDIDYNKQSNRINIIPNNSQGIDESFNLPKIKLVNHSSNFITLPRKWDNQVIDTTSVYKAIWKNDTVTTNIYRPQVNELFEFNFGDKNPDKVTVKMEYLTNSIEESDFPQQSVLVVKNGDYYEFNHQPIAEPNSNYGSIIYIIEATWGENVCEYAFVVDNKWTFMAYEKLEERMKELKAMDYCVVGNWVYYVVLGDEAGFHKMLLDGTQDTLICDFSNVAKIGGSVGVTSEYTGDYILYKMQALREYDENGQLCEDPHPIDYYRLDLSNDTLEPIDK